jgi:nucleoside-diphosphate-sugar epimerase
MAAFITGGYGQIGSWIAYLLAKEGEEVIIFDNQPVPPDYLACVSKQIKYIRGDIMDFPLLTKIFKEHQGAIDGIVHTVAVMGPFVPVNPYRNVSLNIGSMLNVLEIARLFEIEKVVYTSTGAVYGEAEGTATEDGYPANPADLYGATKVSAEHLGLQYRNTFGLDYRISRVFFLYGPGKLPSNFIQIYQLAFGALEGINGLKADKGADQEIDFTHVEDAARGTMLLYRAKFPKHRIYNIATGIPISVGDAAALSQKHSHYPVKVDIGAGTLMPRCNALDITRAREEFGYTPKYDLEAGIKDYADWIKKQVERS